MKLFQQTFSFASLFFLVGSLYAQNWLPFNTGRTYQYANAVGKQFYTLRVDSIKQVGNAKVFYFDRKTVSFNARFPSGYFGREMQVSADTQKVRFVVPIAPLSNDLDLDTLSLRLHAHLGDAWVFNQRTNQTISLQRKEVQNVLGELDSVQVFVTSGNDTMVLSKTYGLVRSRYLDQNFGSGYLRLNAIKELNKGTFLPDLRRMFDFTAGDIFIRKGAGDEYVQCEYLYRVDTVLSKTSLDDTLRYEMGSKVISGSYDSDKRGGYVLTGYTIRNARWKQFVTSDSWGPLTHYYDEQILTLLTSEFSYELDGKSKMALYKDTIQIKLFGFESGIQRTFVKGLGLVLESFQDDNSYCTGRTNPRINSLICWKTAQSTSPDFGSCLSSVVLAVETHALANVPTLRCYPNPTYHTLTIEMSENVGEMEIKVVDLLGASVLEQKALAPLSVLYVSSLANGIYTVIVKTNAKSYRYSFVKE